jgi:hypothetical protein
MAVPLDHTNQREPSLWSWSHVLQSRSGNKEFENNGSLGTFPLLSLLILLRPRATNCSTYSALDKGRWSLRAKQYLPRSLVTFVPLTGVSACSQPHSSSLKHGQCYLCLSTAWERWQGSVLEEDLKQQVIELQLKSAMCLGCQQFGVFA